MGLSLTPIGSAISAVGNVAKAVGAFFGWRQQRDTLEAGQAEQAASDLTLTTKVEDAELQAAVARPDDQSAIDRLRAGKA